MTMDASPKVMPVLQIGIVGHRNLPGADAPAIQQVIADLLARCEAGAKAALAATGWPGFAQDATPAPELRFVSAIAAGADQIGAAAALACGWKLLAPLPFARETYRNDFPDEAGKAAYDGFLARAAKVFEVDGIPGRADAYSSVGQILQEQSDILIAVWNGEAERGLGGTGETVRNARAADMPVIVIAPSAPHAVQIFASTQDATPESMVAQVLAPPHMSDGVDAMAVYYRERKFGVGRLAKRLANAERVALFHARLPPRPTDPTPNSEGLDVALAAVDLVMSPYLAAADQLAVRYATLYRASVSLKYLAVLPTVLAGLILFFVTGPWGVVLGFLAQVIGVITFLIGYNDRRAGWHRRFIDYRYMAERLRYAALMAMFASTSTLPRLPPFQVGANSDWVNWYLHFAVRDLGLIQARCDGAFMEGLRRALRQMLDEQIDFYVARAQDGNLLAARLQRTGVVFYFATIGFTMAAGAIKLMLFASPHVAALAAQRDLYIFGAGLAAALAATVGGIWPAIFGLRSQREYQRLSQRYDAMVRTLRQHEARLARDGAIHGQTERIAREAVDAMLAEVSDWRVLIKARDLSPY